MTRLLSVGAVCVSLLLSLACGGGPHGPQTEEEALDWARITLPPGATDLHYIGDKGIDFSVNLQFEVPPETDLEPLFDEVGCVPVLGGTPEYMEPYTESAQPWFIQATEYPRTWCIMDAAPIDEHRFVRVFAQEGKGSVIQVQVYGY